MSEVKSVLGNHLYLVSKKGGEMEMKIKRMEEIKAVLFDDKQVSIDCAIKIGLTKEDIKELPSDSVISDRDMKADELDYIICDRCKESIT
jgi:hypothetical protein